MVKIIIDNKLILEWFSSEPLFLAKIFALAENKKIHIVFSASSLQNLLKELKTLIRIRRIRKIIITNFLQLIYNFTAIINFHEVDLTKVEDSIRLYLPILLSTDTKIFIPWEYKNVARYDGYEEINIIDKEVFRQKVMSRTI